MPSLEPVRTPPTSPPHVPLPATKNLPMNAPATPTVRLTQEEIDQAQQDEIAAQAEDLEAAKAEEIESDAAMAALEGAFVPNGISRHRGVGPIQYETRRGLIKVFPGDLVCKVTGPTNPDAPEAEWILEEDWIICSQTILGALLFTVPWKMFPDQLEYRAARIGEERRAAAAEAPPPIAREIEDPEVRASREKDRQLRAQRQPPEPSHPIAEPTPPRPGDLPHPANPIVNPGPPKPTPRK
jgi:hypothetical protein